MSSRTTPQHSSPESFDKNKTFKTEKTLFNSQLKNFDETIERTDSQLEKKENVSSSSYKFLSWREKDRRRRFRDEWKHMWLVIPHGNFEVMCLVCHKVMTQRKLDTIKRHTVRRHTEVLDMDQTERILLFEKLLLEHNSSKFQSHNPCVNGSNLDSRGKRGEPAETEPTDIERLLSSDCVSATSSSSMSPSEPVKNNINQADIKYNPKKIKHARKNMKLNLKSHQKNELIRSTIDSKSIFSKNPLKQTSGEKFSVWQNRNSLEQHINNSSSSNNNVPELSFNNNFNGLSCLSLLQSMPILTKCPWCLEDYSHNGAEGGNAFARLMMHIQKKHSETLQGLVPPFDLSQLSGNPLPSDIVSSPLLMSPTVGPLNYLSNSISNVNMISLLYYQELFRQNFVSNNHNSQFGPASSESLYFHQPSVSGSASTMLPLFSSPSPKNILRPPTSAFNIPLINDQAREDSANSNQSNPDDSHSFEKTFMRRAKFTAESLFSETSCNSAFHSPRPIKVEEKVHNKHSHLQIKTNPTNMEPNESIKATPLRICNVSSESELNHKKPLPNDDNPFIATCSTSPSDKSSLSPKSSCQGNLKCHALRFGPGQDLKTCLMEYVKKRKINAAFILTCCGSLNHAKLRMANSGIPNTTLQIKNFNRHFEIVSLVGSIFDQGCHLHISLADSNGDVIGGHVIGDLIIHTTAEVLLGQLCDVRMRREFDELTGYTELSFSSSDTI